jgi:hypothetical protein
MLKLGPRKLAYEYIPCDNPKIVRIDRMLDRF